MAFVYWWSLGGYLGCGIFYDFFRIPSYVQECNNDPAYVKNFKERVKKKSKVMVGNMWSLLVCSALPQELLSEGILQFMSAIIGPFAAAMAVWVIGNIGNEQAGSPKWALIGSYIMTPLVWYNGTQVLNSCSVPSMLLFNAKGRRWRLSPPPAKPACRQFLYLSMASLLFAGCFSSFLYFNANIHTEGEKVKLRDAVRHFVNSPMFQEFKKNFYKVYNDTRNEGFSKAWENFIELMDPFGSQHALKVLDLPQNATQAEIKERVRTLSKKWHPDKHTDEEAKLLAQEKFLEIQQAGDALLEEKRRRARRNKKSTEL
ncbi:hypothetical protein HAZT_HAZT006819 [Hyalella azteca]|uniref:J domain-containing protein n=1 Tax=Hyalella azteca TaxID=294128 RepID=A0A6A0GXD6_HYAAZ|nr:hypothetical protein HAZT_HAZT006819 [Hyalella azteca]